MSGTSAWRCRVLINGQPIESQTVGTASTEHTTTNYAAGDTFSASIAYSTAGAFPSWADPASGVNVEATVQAGLAGQGWTTQIVGLIDKIDIDPLTGKIDIAGRDYSSLLIDLRVQEGWQNQRSGEVVASLAAKAGLTANIQTEGSPTGQYYQLAHKRSALAAAHKFTTAWDVIRYLANVEGADAWVSGKTLNFVPALSSTAPAFQVALTRTASGVPTLPVTSMRLERNLVLAKGVVVDVISWEPRQRTATTVYWSSRGQIAAGAYSASQTGNLYTFKEPGLTKDQAGARAKQLYDQIVAHQRTVTMEMPLNLNLSPRQAVQISGTNTSFDGKQRIDSIVRRIGWNEASQTATLRNRDVTEDADG